MEEETFSAINLALLRAKVRQDYVFVLFFGFSLSPESSSQQPPPQKASISRQHSPHDINSNDCNVQPATEAKQKYKNCLRDQKTEANRSEPKKKLLQNVGTFPIVNLLPCARRPCARPRQPKKTWNTCTETEN